MNIENMINEIKKYVNQFNPTEQEAPNVINELVRLHNDINKVCRPIECKLSEIGVKYQMDIYIGDEYIDGRHLVLDCDDYSGYEAGEWMSSSETC